MYLGSPSVTSSEDTIWVSHDTFPNGRTTYLLASSDGGATWQRKSVIDNQYWSSLFRHQGEMARISSVRSLRGVQDFFHVSSREGIETSLYCVEKDPRYHAAGSIYLLGVSNCTKGSSVVISRSDDGGSSWNQSTLFAAPQDCAFATGAVMYVNSLMAWPCTSSQAHMFGCHPHLRSCARSARRIHHPRCGAVVWPFSQVARRISSAAPPGTLRVRPIRPSFLGRHATQKIRKVRSQRCRYH